MRFGCSAVLQQIFAPEARICPPGDSARQFVVEPLFRGFAPGTVPLKLNAAYALDDYAAAKQVLDGLHHELMHLNPSAARSLAEGLEETLTVHRLHVPQQLR
jgi:hypothetical protein